MERAHEKYERLIARCGDSHRSRAPWRTRATRVAARGARGGPGKADRPDPRRPREEDQERRRRAPAGPRRHCDRGRAAQHGVGRGSGRARPRRQGRGPHEGQPPHRRADGRGREARTGLRTKRRISHCFVMDVPASTGADHHRRGGEHRPDARGQGRHRPERHRSGPRLRRQDAEGGDPLGDGDGQSDVPSTIEAGALCKMADRGQITGGVLDGPLALDNAINLDAAKIKKIDSPVAGQADILVVPDLEAGNMLAKSLTYLAAPTGRGSSSARGCRSSSPAGPTRSRRAAPRAPWRCSSRTRGGSVPGEGGRVTTPARFSS